MIKLLAMNYSPRPDNYAAVSHRCADGSVRGRNTCFVNTSPNSGDCVLHLMKQMLVTTGGNQMPSLSSSEAALWGETPTPASPPEQDGVLACSPTSTSQPRTASAVSRGLSKLVTHGSEVSDSSQSNIYSPFILQI